MIILIGGPSRCGKTTLAKQVEKELGISFVSLDALRHSLSAVASGRTKKNLDVAPSHQNLNVHKWVKLLRKRDKILWQGSLSYLELMNKNSDNVYMEGCIWPDFISGLEIPYKAVFMIDTSPNQHERLINTANDKSTHNNWQKEKSREWLQGWSKYNRYRSLRYKELANKHDMMVFDIGELGFSKAQELAIKYLLELE
jgi:adenylate kinase family enzyme